MVTPKTQRHFGVASPRWNVRNLVGSDLMEPPLFDLIPLSLRLHLRRYYSVVVRSIPAQITRKLSKCLSPKHPAYVGSPAQDKPHVHISPMLRSMWVGNETSGKLMPTTGRHRHNQAAGKESLMITTKATTTKPIIATEILEDFDETCWNNRMN